MFVSCTYYELCHWHPIQSRARNGLVTEATCATVELVEFYEYILSCVRGTVQQGRSAAGGPMTEKKVVYNTTLKLRKQEDQTRRQEELTRKRVIHLNRGERPKHRELLTGIGGLHLVLLPLRRRCRTTVNSFTDMVRFQRLCKGGIRILIK